MLENFLTGANLCAVSATAVLATHLAWTIWVIFGWLIARNRPVLRWLHFLSLIYSILVEIASRPHPLTSLERWLESKAGVAMYGQRFLTPYLRAVVYPDVPGRVLASVAVAVFTVNLYLHLRRFQRQ